ncbi:MAG: alpha/beta fold hydrolase [Planctomycetota bacterium]|nr:alpha/beta fold hydrolase [Planctomycetota bacterium]
MKARIRGTEIYFDVDGAGLVPDGERMVQRPTLFLLHGGPGGDHVGFKSTVARLVDVAQLVYVDHRGSGRSAASDPSTHTLDENIDDVDALRDYLGLDSICLLGSSYGGMVAQGYAIRYPDRVSNLVLCATAPSYRFLEDAKRIVAERGTPEQQAVYETLWNGSFESLEQVREYYQAMGPMYSVTHDAEKSAESWSRGTRNFEQLNLGFSDFLRDFDYTEQLDSIACPTLVLAGQQDWICPPNHSRDIAERVPRAHLKVFSKSAHNIAGDEPEEFLAAVRGFLTYALS